MRTPFLLIRRWEGSLSSLSRLTEQKERLRKSPSIELTHSLHRSVEIRAEYNCEQSRTHEESLQPSSSFHAFEFKSKITESKPRNKKKANKTRIERELFVGGDNKTSDIKFKSKAYIFCLGSGVLAKGHCEKWIKVIESASEKARIHDQRKKYRKTLQGGLRRVYDAKPFQVHPILHSHPFL